MAANAAAAQCAFVPEGEEAAAAAHSAPGRAHKHQPLSEQSHALSRRVIHSLS